MMTPPIFLFIIHSPPLAEILNKLFHSPPLAGD